MVVTAARAVNADLAPFDVLVTNPDTQTDPHDQKEQNATDHLGIEPKGGIGHIRLFKRLHN